MSRKPINLQSINDLNMKKTFLYFPLLAVTLLVCAGCPATQSGSTTGTDSTQVDSVKPGHDYANAVIKLERTLCFGRCPDYTLEILGDGTVNYDGHDFVQVKGKQTAKIAADAVKGLVDEFFKIDYFALQDSFVEPVTDMPTTITSIRIDGKFKQVYNYFGAPQQVRDLELKIDEVANSAQWVSKAEER